MMKRLLLGMSFGVLSYSAAAQEVVSPPGPQPITIGERFSLTSKVLGEERAYSVYLPASYRDSTYGPRHYPVLYLLDGDAHFHSASGVVRFMSAGINGNIQIPELIVVAIANTNRNRDLTPTYSTIGNGGVVAPSLEVSGGGDRFLDFVERDLFAVIDSTYRTLPYRVLVGHSFGGLLTLHALLDRSEMFQSYLAIDPSLWWDDQVLVKRAEGRVTESPPLSGSVYVALANNRTLGLGDPVATEIAGREFDDVLQTAASPTFRPELAYFESEDHGSVPLVGLYFGLLHTFEGFRASRVMYLEQPSQLSPHFDGVRERFGVQLLPPERSVDRLGRYLLSSRDDPEKAVRVFRFNAESNPQSYHAYGSLGDAYRVLGDTTLAVAAYRRSLQLWPGNPHAQAGLETLGGQGDN